MKENQYNIKFWLDDLGNLKSNNYKDRSYDIKVEDTITIERPTKSRVKSLGVRYEKNKKSRINEIAI